MIAFKTVGVVGAGTMGAALAQKFIQEGFKVILVDRSMEFVEKGTSNIKAMLNQGIERKVFSPEQVSTFLSRLTGSDKLADLKSCDIVIEAIFENFEAKTQLFKELNDIVNPRCIMATNTSSYSITELSEVVKDPSRFIGLHFFYHAAKNRLVEIIPGDKTSKETYDAVRYFTVLAGKDAIDSKDVYGFVVNRFFVPWLNESARLYEDGIGSIARIDKVGKEVLGIGMGPFELMNATGVPVAFHAEKTLEVFGSLYKIAGALEIQAKSGKQWPYHKEDELTLTEDPKLENKIRERMLGVVFLICCQILDEKVCTATDLNKGARIGLKWRKGPVEMMNKLGEAEVKRLIEGVCKLYHVNMPQSVGMKYWKTEAVQYIKKGDTAVITFNQPENLNAINEGMIKQLAEAFDAADNDKEIKTIFITGSGKAFMAGADIKFFVKNIQSHTIGNIESFTQYGQEVFDRIDKSKKKVVAIINGLALGGGMELALCADTILASPGATMAFPETGIGIYPGLGGTQRTIKKVGKALSKYLIYSGKMLTARDGYDIGLIDTIITPSEMMEILNGTKEIPQKSPKALDGKWKAIEEFFSKNSLNKILNKEYDNYNLPAEETEKLQKTINYKAPVAIRIADKLIEEEKGCKSELTHLKEIFSTSDALLGLSNIGKKVSFEGK